MRSKEDGAFVDAGLGIVSVLTAPRVAEAALTESDFVAGAVALLFALVAIPGATLDWKGLAVRRLKGTRAVGSTSALDVEGARLATVVTRRGKCERTLR